jgi:hypothetical protein
MTKSISLRFFCSFFPLLAPTLSGCPSDSNGPQAQTPDADAADEVADVRTDERPSGDASSDPATEAGADASDDAALDLVERKTTIVLAAPNLKPQYICLAAFEADENGEPVGDLHAVRVRNTSNPLPPFGIPDPSDPTRLRAGLPYGTVFPVGVFPHDADLEATFDRRVAVGFVLDADPGPTGCVAAYEAVKDKPGRTWLVRPGTVGRGQSWVFALTGCEGPSSDPACAGGNNLTADLQRVDTATPSDSHGVGDIALGVQFWNLGPFAGYQNVDVYVQPMKPAAEPGDAEDGSDAGAVTVANGPPVPLANGSHWRDIAQASVGVRLSDSTRQLTELLLVRHDEMPFCGGAPGCANTVGLPMQPFIDRYASPAGAAWSGNLVVGLFGRGPLASTESVGDVVRLAPFSGFVDNHIVNPH